jgi:hypothetical protein
MYASVKDWQLHDFGMNNGVSLSCVHSPGGSKDIRASGIIHNTQHGAQVFTISGTVTFAGSGLAGVLMSGLGSTPPTTDANGNYSGTVPYSWSGTVTPQKTGYTFTPASIAYSNVTASQTAQNYTASQTFTISGTVTFAGSGLAGVLMSGLGSTPPTTDANGNYSGTVASGWSGTVTPQKTYYSFTPTSKSYTNVTANQTQNYTAAYANPAPTISGITPNSGVNSGSVSITNLAGTGFLTGVTVKLTKSGQTDINGTSVTRASATKITCTFNLTGAATGPWNVVVTNPDGQSATLPSGFTIAYPAPTITSITPNSGSRGTTVNITNLAGTGFRTGATVNLTRSGQTTISGTSVTVVSSTKITCTFTIPTTAATGRWNVVVTNSDGKSATLSNGFTIN